MDYSSRAKQQIHVEADGKHYLVSIIDSETDIRVQQLIEVMPGEEEYEKVVTKIDWPEAGPVIGSCYDCGSKIPGHHTALCDLAGEEDVKDLPARPGTQYWTGEPYHPQHGHCAVCGGPIDEGQYWTF